MNELLTTTFHAPTQTRLRYGIVERVGERLQRPLLASVRAELLFPLELTWDQGLAWPRLEVALVLKRGEETRWRKTFALQAGVRCWRQAFALAWQDRTAASTRLRVEVWLAGECVAEATALLTPISIDAQGRLRDARETAVSEATRMAYVGQIRRWTGAES